MRSVLKLSITICPFLFLFILGEMASHLFATIPNVGEGLASLQNRTGLGSMLVLSLIA
jgi:hypothetical protein